MNRETAQRRLVLAMGLGGVDDVVATLDPVAHQLLGKIRRMLAVAVHEQHRTEPGMVEACHQCSLLAEIARQRHRLHVEFIGRQVARDRQRGVCRAVVDVNHFAGQAIALLQFDRERRDAVVQRHEARGLVEQRYHDGQPVRGGGKFLANGGWNLRPGHNH